jgi:hypothetical protein
MIAGGGAAHGDESPFEIVSNVHAVIAVAESSNSSSSPKAIVIGDCSPDIQIKSLLMPQGVRTDGDGIAPLPHLSVGRDNIASTYQSSWANPANFPVSIPNEIVLYKPFSICCRKIPSIANLYMRDCFTAVRQYMNAAWANAQISALEDSGLSGLSSRNYRQNSRVDGNYDYGYRQNFFMVGLDVSVSEPAPIDPNRREEFRQHGIALMIIVALFVGVIGLLTWWLS